MSNDTQEQIEATKVRMKANGDLIQRVEGKEILLAHYDRATSFLEYATKAISEDVALCVKIQARITMNVGASGNVVNPTGLKILNFGIKGEARPNLAKLPPKPKLGPLGDAAYNITKWYHDHDPAQFKVRYRVLTDENGEYVRKHARRIAVEMIDQRNEDGTDMGKTPEGKKSFTTGPVSREGTMLENEHAIIARRETHPGPNGEPPITFTPQEVVGGFQPDQEFEDVLTAEGGADE